MKKLTTTALVALSLALSAPAPASAGVWSSIKSAYTSASNAAVRGFHRATRSKPTAYDRVYNNAYRSQGYSSTHPSNPNNCTRSCN